MVVCYDDFHSKKMYGSQNPIIYSTFYISEV